MFSILATDKLAKAGLAWIESQPDADLVYRPGLGETEAPEAAVAAGAGSGNGSGEWQQRAVSGGAWLRGERPLPHVRDD